MVLLRRIVLGCLVGWLLVCVGCASVPDRLAPPARAAFTILTYNVLAENYRNEDRIPALFEIFSASEADVFCLQEVLPEFLAKLQGETWFKDRYHLPMQNGEVVVANGNTICTRDPIERVDVIDHESRQGRKSLMVHVRVDGSMVGIATCHLESLLEDGLIRAQQLDDVFGRLADSEDAIFAGDFNFGDGEQPDTAHLDGGYVDLWTRLHPGKPGFTWNIEESDMAARGSFPTETSRRIDRILVRSKRWQPQSIRIVGGELLDVEGLIHPSDHFGLVGVLRLQR